jgi:hypothetical protein
MRMARSTGALSGALIVLLGLWGALIPFLGPYFNYSFGVNSTWHYTADRLWLSILPGVLAIVGGVLLIVAATRLTGVIGGWLALLAGAWFAIGPAVSLTWESGQGPIGRPLFGHTRQMLELLGYFYGLGAAIIALAAFSIGRFASRPRLAEKEAIDRAASTEPVPVPVPYPTKTAPQPPTKAEPQPRRRLRLRRGPAPAERERTPVGR